MFGNTIYDLFKRSIANGPFAEGSDSCVYIIDDPLFDGYLLKVLRRPLTDDGKSFLNIEMSDAILPVKTGFSNMKVGQMVACHTGEGRLFSIIARVPGVTLEAKLQSYVEYYGGNKLAAANAFFEELINLPAKAYGTFFHEINHGTHLAYGLDMAGNNILIGNNELHTIDFDVRYSSDHGHYFTPEHFNHLDSVMTHIHSVAMDGLTPEECRSLWQKEGMLYDKMQRAAEKVGFPRDIDGATKWTQHQGFHNYGILGIDKLKVYMSDEPQKLLKAIKQGEMLDRVAPMTIEKQFPNRR